MIKTILWDVDGTLLSFLHAERAAIRTCFEMFGHGAVSDEELAKYSAINDAYWKRLERGEITKPEVLVGRFLEFFDWRGTPIAREEAEKINAEYQVRLGDTICFNDDSLRLVQQLRGRVGQYAVTNGTRIAQERKLARSGLGELFDGVFISDVIGCEKPGKGFFDYVMAHIPPCAPDEIMIVGDSLTSDIRGGNNAGVLTCWYNPTGAVNDRGEHVDCEIKNLWQIMDLPGVAG